MASPALTLILKAFSDRPLGIIGPSPVCDLFANLKGLRRIGLKRSRSTGVVESILAYRSVRPRSVVLLTRSFASALAAFLGGVPERLGLATDGRRMLLSDPLSVPPRDFLHEQEVFTLVAREAVVRWRGRSEALEEVIPYPHLELSGDEWEGVIKKLGLRTVKKNYALFHPGAAYGTAKRWPKEYFAGLARLFAEKLGWDVYIVGSPSEGRVCDEVAHRGGSPRIVSLAARTTVREMLALQAEAGLVVANDSGAAHTAAALGVPVVVIFGPTDPEKTAPKNPNAKIIKGNAPCSPCTHRHCPTDHHCMTSISINRVWEEALVLLGA